MKDIDGSLVVNDKDVRIRIKGHLYFSHHRNFRELCRQALAHGPSLVAIDLDGLDQIDCAGVGMLAALCHEAGLKRIGICLQMPRGPVADRLRLGGLGANCEIH